MKEVDAAVVLPRGASPLSKYARYYAYRPDGKIAVFYTGYVDQGLPASDYVCTDVTENLAAKGEPCPPPDWPKAGSQHWVPFDRMPEVSDGGCSVINAIYDPATHRVEKAECNGPI